MHKRTHDFGFTSPANIDWSISYNLLLSKGYRLSDLSNEQNEESTSLGEGEMIGDVLDLARLFFNDMNFP